MIHGLAIEIVFEYGGNLCSVAGTVFAATFEIAFLVTGIKTAREEPSIIARAALSALEKIFPCKLQF